MIMLRRGDVLPTVTVLQCYLNQQPSTQKFLEVDGIFGPKTEAAVARFRATAVRLAGARYADYEVWRQVVGAEWQIIDSVDRSDHDSPRHAINDHLDLAPYGQTLLEQFGISMGSPLVLTNVRSKARIGEVVLLTFHGHGSPGHMIVSSGRIAAGSSLDHRYGKGLLHCVTGSSADFCILRQRRDARLQGRPGSGRRCALVRHGGRARGSGDRRDQFPVWRGNNYLPIRGPDPDNLSQGRVAYQLVASGGDGEPAAS